MIRFLPREQFRERGANGDVIAPKREMRIVMLAPSWPPPFAELLTGEEPDQLVSVRSLNWSVIAIVL